VRCGFCAGNHGPEQTGGRQEVEVSDSDLVEVVKRNGEFRKWGMFWGPLLYLRTLNAARPPRSILWKGLALVGTVVGGLWWRYG
jgi:hypothetical protein